jgi:hypothetical protein
LRASSGKAWPGKVWGRMARKPHERNLVGFLVERRLRRDRGG